MTENVALISTHPITKQELAEAIFAGGGVLTPENISFGRISRGTRHIWIYLEEPEVFLSTLDAEQQDNPAGWELVRTKLGGEPRSAIGIEVSRTSGSQKLAVDFANLCAQRWPCVAVGADINKDVFSKEELLQLQREGKGIINYGM